MRRALGTAWSLALLALTMATGPSHAAEDETRGRWGASEAACSAWAGSTAADTALMVTSYAVVWYDGFCRIGRMYKTGKAVHMEAHCWNQGDRPTPVTLEASGNRMKASWNRGPATLLKRCS